jgi:membrane protease YdiL (CAAX protease family)
VTTLIARERRIPVYFALLLYGSMAVAAMIWIRFAGPRSFSAMLLESAPWEAMGAGLLAGLFMAGAAAALSVTVPAVRELETEFAEVCADQRAHEIVILSILSGAAEELYFRGAMQPVLVLKAGNVLGDGWAVPAGIGLTSAVFAAFHVPWSRRMVTWPLLAFGAGVLLGLLMVWTGSLAAPMAAHMAVNAIGLTRIAARFSTRRIDDE